jgi:hypothetical protein
MTNTPSWDKVKSVVAKFWSVMVDKLNRETRLEDDLGITGDDAIAFFDAFYNEFEVDLKSLDLRKYFGSEGFGLINFTGILGKRGIKRSAHEINLGDLENTLVVRKWIDPE